MRKALLLSGLIALAAAWLGPLPDLARQSFAAHMAMHMSVVAVAAPLIALGLAGTAADPVRKAPGLFAPIPASMIELIVVWSWHAPALHHAARQFSYALALEQGSFVAAGLLLWLAVLGGSPRVGAALAPAPTNDMTIRARRGAGIVALLFTSMHMTLLGALFAMANRPLFAHGGSEIDALARLDDQHLGGAIMLMIGGASYLAGGLWLTAGLLRPSAGRSGVRVGSDA